MAEFPAPQSASGGSNVPVTAGVLAYALFAISAVVALASTGMPCTLASASPRRVKTCLASRLTLGVIVCYVKRGDAQGTWVASHFTWLIRTFWWSLLWAILGWVILLLLLIVLIGIPIAYAIWFCAGILVIYRVVRGYLLFKDSKPIPGV